MHKIRILQVGCGRITNSWFTPATQFDDLEYVGLCDLNPDAAREKRDKFGLNPQTPIFSDLETALRETSPDAVFDCTIPAAHTPTALLSFEHGAHVLRTYPNRQRINSPQWNETRLRGLGASVRAGGLRCLAANLFAGKGAYLDRL